MKKWQKIWCGILAAALLLSGYAQLSPAKALSEESAETAEPEDQPEEAAEPEDSDEEVERADWWTVPVFAHALGTVDGRTETNSLDAFLQSYAAGQRVFEVDLQLTSDGHLVARHDWEQISYYNLEQTYAGVMDWETFKNTPIIFYYTPLDVEGLVSLLQEYPDVYLVTDSKDTDEATVRAQIREFVRAIGEIGDQTLWERIVVQIYHEDMYTWISEEAPVTNWIFTLYQIITPDYERIGAFCRDHDIPVVTLSTERLTKEHVEILHRYGRLIYVHTVNRLRMMLETSWGADGFYSDYVSPDQLKAVLDRTNQMYLSAPQDPPEEQPQDQAETAPQQEAE